MKRLREFGERPSETLHRARGRQWTEPSDRRAMRRVLVS
jgi:hypothetical protein